MLFRSGLAAAALTLESGSVLEAPFSPDTLALRMGGRRASPEAAAVV